MAGFASGWTASTQELLTTRLLTEIIIATRDGRSPEVRTLAGHLTDDDDALITALKTLESQDLVSLWTGLANNHNPTPTSAGKAVETQRAERRTNPRLRSVACREAILDWLHGKTAPPIDDFFDDIRCHFEGDPFTQEEVTAATKSLKDKGLISGTSAWGGTVIRPNLTAEGATVIESHDGSIKNYDTRHQPVSGGTSYTINTHTLSGQLAVGNGNTLSQSGSDSSAELSQLLNAILDASRGTSGEDKITKLVTQLSIEASDDEPDPAILNKNLDRLEVAAIDVGKQSLIEAVKIAVRFLGQYFGLTT